MARVIKNEVEYEQVFARLNALLDQQPTQGTPDSDEIELLSVLFEDYETRTGAAPTFMKITWKGSTRAKAFRTS